MKTTPGPWIARNNGHFWEVGTSLVEFAHSVAHVPQSAFMPGDAEANARLLASAPELLAALNAALDDVDAHWSVGCEPPEWAEQARAAVAKADGDKS